MTDTYRGAHLLSQKKKYRCLDFFSQKTSMKEGLWPLAKGLGATAAVVSAVLGAAQLYKNGKTDKGRFLLELDDHFVSHYLETHKQVEKHAKLVAKNPDLAVPFDFGSDEEDEKKKVAAVMPGFEGSQNFDKRRAVLDYASFFELVYRLKNRCVIDHEDIDHMYKYRIIMLVAHPYVFDTMRKGGYKGLRAMAFDFLSQSKPKNKEAKEVWSREYQLAWFHLCHLSSEKGWSDSAAECKDVLKTVDQRFQVMKFKEKQ